MTGTTQEFADRMGEYATALAVIKLLVVKGIAKQVGVSPNTTGKGKGANLFTIPTTPITFTV